jgi:16S rRNA (cytosine1407-C5)-methyltransferase
MRNQGQISAVEVVRGRYYKLCDNLRTAGASIVRTYLKDGRSVGNKTPERFDRVLIDAPCSSEARFRCDQPETWGYWSLRKIREQARKQRGLLKSGVRALKRGGLLAYCTCSFAPEENEVVIDRQLRRDDSMEVVPLDGLPIDNVQPGLTQWEEKPLSTDLNKAIRVLPTESMDGFFICLLRKR